MFTELILRASDTCGPTGLGFPKLEAPYIETTYADYETTQIVGFSKALMRQYGMAALRGMGCVLVFLRMTAEELGQKKEFDDLVAAISEATWKNLVAELRKGAEAACKPMEDILINAMNYAKVLDKIGRTEGRQWMIGQMSTLELLRRTEADQK